jgi:DNA invertase Pin-like site-specific DNA recombinase
MAKKTDTEKGGRRGPASRRAIGYLRVSTAGQAERGMGLQAQRTKVEEYAREHSLELVELVRETAGAGVRDGEALSHEHRPRLLELLERAKAGAFDVLLVAKLDRLSRDHATLVFLERTFRRHGVEVISATEENGEGAYAEFVRGILAQVAQLERQVILERVRGGKEQKKKLGRHVHGRVPYGYRSTAGVLEPAPELVPVVRRIFEEARDGWTPGKIALRLNREGVPSPRGKAWSPQVIRGILENVAYAGERYGVKRAHAPIVSRRVFNEAQTALAARRQPSKSHRRANAPD